MTMWGGSGAPGYRSATAPVRLTGARSSPDAFVLGAALRAVATPRRNVGVAVTWFGPRSWRLSVTPAPPDASVVDLNGVAVVAVDIDLTDDDYRKAATLFVDFDEDERERRIARLVADPAPDPFASLPLYEPGPADEPVPVHDESPDDESSADPSPDEPAAAEPLISRARAERAVRAEAGAAVAVELGQTLADFLGAVTTPPSGAEDAATARGLAARPGPQPDLMWQADTAFATTLRTQLCADEIVDCLRDVPFVRHEPATGAPSATPAAAPVVFVVGSSGHAAGQVVTVTVVGDDASGSTVLLSYLVEGSGDPLVDVVVGTRARACVETICAAVLSHDRSAVRDDGPGAGR